MKSGRCVFDQDSGISALPSLMVHLLEDTASSLLCVRNTKRINLLDLTTFSMIDWTAECFTGRQLINLSIFTFLKIWSCNINFCTFVWYCMIIYKAFTKMHPGFGQNSSLVTLCHVCQINCDDNALPPIFFIA